MKTLFFMALASVAASALAPAGAGAAPKLGLRIVDLLWFAECDTVDHFWIVNDGDGVLEWTITCEEEWYSVQPASGSNPPGWENRTLVVVHVDKTGFADGRHDTNLRTINSNGGWAAPAMYVLVSHAAKLQTTETINLSLESPNEPLVIASLGEAALSWSVSANQPWIEIAPPHSGIVPSCGTSVELTVSVDPAALPSPDEMQEGGVTVASDGGNAVVPVTYFPSGQTGGIIGLYTDPAGLNCNIIYGGPGLRIVYVVHTRTAGATACQFSAPKPVCWTNTIWLGDSDIFPVTIGNTQTGKSVPYGVCRVGTVHATSMNYFIQSPSSEICCVYPVLPDPNVPSGEILVADCEGGVLAATGGYAVVNPTAGCFCGEGVAVEKSTWGRVKALYAPK